MRKKRTFFVLIVAVFLITLTTKVMAYFDEWDYSHSGGWDGLGEVIEKGEKIRLADIQNAIYLDKDDNFVLANFTSDEIYDMTYLEELTYNYSDNEYYTSKEECEEEREYYYSSPDDPDELICNNTSYTLKRYYNYTSFEIPLGEPITDTIKEVECLTTQDESKKCYIDSYKRDNNYKNIETYQFIGYVKDVNKLYENFNFTNEEKTKLNELIEKYGIATNHHLVVYKENHYTDVTLELTETAKNETNNARLVSSNPQNIDYIVFSINEQVANVKNLKASDNWELSTFTDVTEEYDEIQDEYIDIERTFYSLKNKNHTQDNFIATIQIEGKEKITDDTVIIKEYQQMENIKAFVKDGEHYHTYGCGSEFNYSGGGCDSPYQSADQGNSYNQIAENTFYYPQYCVIGKDNNIEYDDYKVPIRTKDAVPNKKIIKYSSPQKIIINNNPKTQRSVIPLVLSLEIILIFSILLKKQEKKK